MENLQGRFAVVTGGGSGIGAAVARELARRGVAVVVADVEDRALAVAEEIAEIGDRAIGVLCDVRDASSLVAAREVALTEFGRVDILVNNAGVLSLGNPEDLPLEEWERLVEVNLLGVVRGVHAFLPHFLAQGQGHIVNTASVAGLFPYSPDMLPYSVTKAGVLALSEGLALSADPRGVGVTCLCPAGVAPTRIGESAIPFTEALQLHTPPLDRVSPEEVGVLVADAIVPGRFLLVTDPRAAEFAARHGADVDGFLAEVAAQLRAGDTGNTPSI